QQDTRCQQLRSPRRRYREFSVASVRVPYPVSVADHQVAARGAEDQAVETRAADSRPVAVVIGNHLAAHTRTWVAAAAVLGGSILRLTAHGFADIFADVRQVHRRLNGPRSRGILRASCRP